MAADRASIQAFLDQAGQVWKTNDGGAFAELFTEDGSLINPFGERVDGRERSRCHVLGVFQRHVVWHLDNHDGAVGTCGRRRSCVRRL